VRVKPQVADFFFVFAIVRGDPGSNSSSDRVIATENKRQKSFAERFLDGRSEILAGLRDFLQILGALFADLHFFRLLHFEVADIFHVRAKLLDPRLQSSAAQGGRAHVHAAAALAQVHRHTNDANFLRHASLMFRDPCSCPAKTHGTHAREKRVRFRSL